MEELKQSLIDVDYPNARTFSEDDIGNLFETENLPVFFRWFVGEIFTDLKPIEFDNLELIDIIYEFGFCTTQQKDHLYKGTLDHKQQFVMINHMLSHIRVIKRGNQETNATVSLRELNDLVTRKINLFEQLPAKNQCKNLEETDRATSLRAQIQEITERLELSKAEFNKYVELDELGDSIDADPMDVTYKNENDNTVVNNDDKDNSDMLTELSSNVMDFLVKTKLFQEQKNPDQSTNNDNGTFNDEFLSQLDNSCKGTLELEAIFNSLTILDDYSKQEPQNLKIVPESKNSVDKLLKIAESL